MRDRVAARRGRTLADFLTSRVRSRRRRCRRGVTAMEVVVIGLLLLFLAALLLPAQNTGFDLGRQNICRNNLRQLSIALFQYANKTRANNLPGYINALERDDGFAYHDSRTGRVEPVSWVVMILPELDRQALYTQWKSGEGPRGQRRIESPARESTHVYLEFLVCPSDPQPDRNGTPTRYAVNGGIPDFPEVSDAGTPPAASLWRRGSDCRCAACDPTAQGGGGATRLPARDHAANGVFFDALTTSKHFDPKVRREPVISSMSAIGDLKERTILPAENVDATNYTLDPGGPSAPWVDETYPWAERQWAVTWAPNSTLDEVDGRPRMTPPSETFGVNVGAGEGEGRSYAHARPSSKHPNGFNAAFAGTQVLFLKDNISYYVYAKLMASDDAGAGAVDAGGTRQLMPAAFRSRDLTDEEVNP